MRRGFTLIELLVVIGILAILLAIVLIAINPARQFQQANDTKRRSDVNAILNAVNQFMAENDGIPPAGVPDTTAGAGTISEAGVDICGDLVPTFIAELPVDPQVNNGTPSTCAAGYDTGYTIVVSTTDNRITVAAPNVQGGGTIQVTR